MAKADPFVLGGGPHLRAWISLIPVDRPDSTFDSSRLTVALHHSLQLFLMMFLCYQLYLAKLWPLKLIFVMCLAFQNICSLISAFNHKSHLIMSWLSRYLVEFLCSLLFICTWYCTWQQSLQKLTKEFDSAFLTSSWFTP